MLQIVRSSHVATTLRTSALSLLADCEGVYAPALLPYFVDLSSGMVDLLQVETEPPNSDASVSMDSDPTSTNSKFPPLRRAALHFLTLLYRETISQIYDYSLGKSLFTHTSINRAKVTLSYIAATDGDAVVRVMAGEASTLLGQLQREIAGLV